MHLPNLLVLGPPKCGTSTFYTICEGHPDICVSSFKEPTFFSEEENFKRGLEWYSNKYFSHCNGKRIVSEFTPAYFSSEAAVRNIQSSLGTDTKFVVVLRNPAKRSYSHYIHLKREGRISTPFDELMYQLAADYSKNPDLKDKIGKIYTESLYDVHLTNFFKYFPDRSKLLILKFEDDVKNDCLGFKTKLSDFMNLDLQKFPSQVEIQNSATEVSSFIMPVKRFLNTDNFVKRGFRKVFPAHIRYKMGVNINNYLNKKFNRPNIEFDANKLKLINSELFADSIRNTEILTNQKLIDYY